MGVPPLDEPHYGIGFGGAIRRGFVKYATFRGRASRSEYWWWQLFVTLAVLCWYLIIYLVASAGEPDLDHAIWLLLLGGAGYLVLFIPSLALVVRRLHDSGRSGWTYFVSLIPFVGTPILVAFLAAPTSPRAALYGPPSAYPMAVMPALPVPPPAPWTPGPGQTNGGYSDDTVSAPWAVDHRLISQGPATGGAAAAQPTRPGKTGPRIHTVLAVAAVLLAIVCVGGTVRHLLIQRWDEASGSKMSDVQPDTSTETEAAEPQASPNVGGPDIESNSDTTLEEAPSQPPEVVGHKPARAAACPSLYELATTPVRSAVNAKTTTCEFAEEVRRAYIESGQQGGTVQLANVYSPRTHKYYSMLCSGSDTVTCTGGIKAEVFLY